MTVLYTSLRAAVYMGIMLSFFNQPAHAVSLEADRSTAVVYVYQRVGDETVPQSGISTEQFEEHIRELTSGGYTVLPLPKIIDAIKKGDTLPQRAVALTFDGAYTSSLNNAIPLMDAAKLPYTVFFSTDLSDSASPGHMTWDQLKSLSKKKNVTLGLFPAAYTHMLDQSPEQAALLINKAVTRYRDMLRAEPQFFAWPYGEYSQNLKKQLEKYSFAAGFGQQSGIVHDKSDFMSLPRFSMTDMFGDIDRFRLTANALPLPVSDVTPDDMLMSQNPPVIGFTVTPELQNLSKLSCFASGIGKLGTSRLSGNRIEVRILQPLEDRRTRINCTLPDEVIIPGEPQAWRWFGMMLVDPANTADTSSAAENFSEPE